MATRDRITLSLYDWRTRECLCQPSFFVDTDVTTLRDVQNLISNLPDLSNKPHRFFSRWFMRVPINPSHTSASASLFGAGIAKKVPPFVILEIPQEADNGLIAEYHIIDGTTLYIDDPSFSPHNKNNNNNNNNNGEAPEGCEGIYNVIASAAAVRERRSLASASEGALLSSQHASASEALREGFLGTHQALSELKQATEARVSGLTAAVGTLTSVIKKSFNNKGVESDQTLPIFVQTPNVSDFHISYRDAVVNAAAAGGNVDLNNNDNDDNDNNKPTNRIAIIKRVRNTEIIYKHFHFPNVRVGKGEFALIEFSLRSFEENNDYRAMVGFSPADSPFLHKPNHVFWELNKDSCLFFAYADAAIFKAYPEKAAQCSPFDHYDVKGTRRYAVLLRMDGADGSGRVRTLWSDDGSTHEGAMVKRHDTDVPVEADTYTIVGEMPAISVLTVHRVVTGADVSVLPSHYLQ